MIDTAKTILNMIEESSFKAYVVGGYPRDLYLGKKSIDIDICTNATPKDLKEIFNNVNIPLKQYGSVTIYYNKIRFEITTFRKDIKYDDNRHPTKIIYINNLLDDLKRRDFTINTLCMDKNGNIIDLLNGKKDLDNGVIRAVGNPYDKLKEDSLRILRAIRFATILNFDIEKKTSKSIYKNAHYLKKLSYNRKKEELDKIFSSSNVKYGLSLIKKYRLDKYLELSNIDKIKNTSSIIGIWAQLDVLNIYPFTNHEKDMIEKINHLCKKDILDNNNLYKYGLYVSLVAGEIMDIDKKDITKKYNDLYIHSQNDICLDASHLCEILNRKPGPWIKDIVNDLTYKLINKEITNEKEVLIDYIKSNYFNQ